jgi:hypothetical protein
MPPLSLGRFGAPIFHFFIDVINGGLGLDESLEIGFNEDL